jgi:putative spermidine/putrescine transport system permease protein
MIPATPELLKTADGRPLCEALVAAQARSKRRAFLLVFPLLVFVLLKKHFVRAEALKQFVNVGSTPFGQIKFTGGNI